VVSYEGKLADDLLVDKQENFLFTLGEGNTQVHDGLEKAIESMKLGEKCEVRISPKYYSNWFNVNNVPKGEYITYQIELIELEKAKDPWECKTFDDVVVNAMERKDAGNAFFKENRTELAIKKYDRSLKYLEQSSKLNDEEKGKLKETSATVHLNLSLCHYNLKNYKKSLEQANKALDINGHNTKALYRKGQALVGQGEWDLAKVDYEKALEIEPENKTVKRAMQQLQKIFAKQDKKDKKLYQNMFTQLAKELETEVPKKEETEEVKEGEEPKDE